jgi:two-component system, chemotaxis family, protein-glutamate methylesterase/glutaminase
MWQPETCASTHSSEAIVSSERRRSVLVVDDSALVRRIIADLVEASGEFRVAGTASDGMDAIRKVHALNPDLVTLDVQMPDIDGLQTLGYIMSETPRPVIMLSALEAPRGGDLTIRALEIGAVDFVHKPLGEDSLDTPALRDRLLAALRAACDVNLSAASILARPHEAVKAGARSRVAATHVVAIAASTGGPRALAEIIPRLEGDLGAAVVIVQHMPSGFTESLARRLDRLAALIVREARDGDVLWANHVYVAPGGSHVTVEQSRDRLRLVVSEGSPISGVRPSADRLFTSVAASVGATAVGVVLTGMGRDGSAGLVAMRRKGAYAVVQDRATSTVFGMPMIALERAGADQVVPLQGVAGAIADGLAARGVRPSDRAVTPATRTLS